MKMGAEHVTEAATDCGRRRMRRKRRMSVAGWAVSPRTCSATNRSGGRWREKSLQAEIPYTTNPVLAEAVGRKLGRVLGQRYRSIP